MTEQQLREIEARCKAATAGPWVSCVEGRDHESGSNFIMTGPRNDRGPDIELSGATIADQEFMARARQDVPELLSEVCRLKAFLGKGN
uniref:hypothetical protein n=1 Tax=Castellaniella defragrans TaxID=75697 RepID=UPI003342CF4A